MKVSVLGAGAIGSMLGGLIKHHRPETDVVLIARGAHGQAMSDHGQVVLDGPWGRVASPLRVSFDVQDLAGSDYVLLTVKSQATEAAIVSAGPYLDDATLISIQNGLNQNLLARHVPEEKTVIGVTATNMVVSAPGQVTLQLDGVTILGPPRGADLAPHVRAAQALLQETGMRFEARGNIVAYQGNKLAINAIGYAACLSQSNLVSEALTDRAWRETVGLPLLEECLDTFHRAGISLLPIPKAPTAARIRWFSKRLNSPLMGPVLRWGVKRFYRKPIMYSLGQDLANRKTTEVDFINGEIVRMAEAHGGKAPCNAKIVELVHEMEARGDGVFFSQQEVVERIGPDGSSE